MKRLWFLVLILFLLGSTPAQVISNTGSFLNDLRLDLERLADQVLGDQPRPDGWTGTTDIRSGKMASDLWFDNELLANDIFGQGVRAPNWFGITSSNVNLIARNIRHDLELSADQVFRNPDTNAVFRPDDWQGAAASFRCDRSTQNDFRLALLFNKIDLTTPDFTLNYCPVALAELEGKLFDTLGLSDASDVPEKLLAMRGDLERLADEKLGLHTRPSNWIGNTNAESATLVGDNFLDLETLANLVLGNNVRPPDWIGVVTNNRYISWRNLRHDLELLATEALGPDVRPHGWQRESLLGTCEPAVQDLVLLVTNYKFDVENFESANYCTDIEAAANQLAENPPVEDVVVPEVSDRYLAEAEAAFSYLDVGATEYMGVMPPGTKFRAWYRNFSESNMMFVSGDDFAVFVDRRWTSLPENVFATLPTLEGVAPLTFCDANWCNGPGPTPTPTGSGPLALLLAEATIPAPPSLEGGGEAGSKLQVSWNNVRVTYITDNVEAGTALVALELCNEPAQINCEPVQSVFDGAIGTTKPVLSQFNGLNVFEFPYGYTSGLVIEGATLTSPDVWISDPSIR